MSTALVVELCGLPGAGKTTIAHAVAALLRRDGVDATVVDHRVSAATPRPLRVLRKAVAAARDLAADPLQESRAAKVLGANQSRARDKVAVPVQWWVTKRLVVQSRTGGGVAVLEEGLVQGLWTAGLDSQGPSSAELVRFACTGALPDLVVHVDIPPLLAVERLTSRRSQHSRVQRLSPPEQVGVLQRGDDLLRALLQEWKGRELSDVVVVRGDADHQSIARLADVLRRGASVQSCRRTSPG